LKPARKAFIRKWRLRHRPVADCLEEAGARRFAFADCRRANGVNQCDRMAARGVQTKDQDADGAAIGGYRCYSGRCLPPARSTCARSMAARRSPQSPSINRLTSQPETIRSVTGDRANRIPKTSRAAPSQSRLFALKLLQCHSLKSRSPGDVGTFVSSKPNRPRSNVRVSQHHGGRNGWLQWGLQRLRWQLQNGRLLARL